MAAMRSRRVLGAIALLALFVCAPAQKATVDVAEGEGGLGPGCPFEITVPWTYAKTVTVDMSEDVEVDQDDPMALSTVCTCPASEGMSTTCTCEGPKEDDCDAYAQMLAGTFLTSEKFMGIFMHMDTASKEYHIENIAFWTILGQILVWIGFIMILYSEIKTVIIIREKDERDRLVMMNYLRRNEKETERLNKHDEDAMVPRPYLTVGGGVLLWLGLVCQLTPFCKVISLLFPGLGDVNEWCMVLVLVGTLVLALSFFLLLVGLIWSCTRRWAALVLIALGLLGDLMVFGGLASIVVWVALAIGVLLAYFKWAPQHYEEQGQPYPSWLEDLGNIVRVGSTMHELSEAMSKGGKALKEESREVMGEFPGGKKALEGLDSLAETLARAPSGGVQQQPEEGFQAADAGKDSQPAR